VESKNDGKNTCALPADHKTIIAPLAKGRNKRIAATRQRFPAASPIPAILPLVVSVETFLRSAL